MHQKNFFNFDPKCWPVITGHTVKDLLKRKKGDYRFKLGKREVSVSVGNNIVFSWEFPESGRKVIELSRNMLNNIDRTHVYTVFPDLKFSRVSLFQDSYYQLVAPHSSCSFTLEIDGIHMHAVKGTTPLKSTREKVRNLDISPGDTVLDICTGLGYSAIEERRRGGKVLTIEKNREVLQIAQINPYSEGLEEIPILVGDATEEVLYLENESFDKVFHDPPRFSLAGDLYSLEFYEGLWRLLRRKGNMFHYTGNPGKYQNKNFRKGIKNRLKEARFEIIKETDNGVLVRK